MKSKSDKSPHKTFARFSPQVLKTKFKSKSGAMTHLKSSKSSKETIEERRKQTQATHVTATTDSALPNNIKLVQKSFPQNQIFPFPNVIHFTFQKYPFLELTSY